MSELQIIINGNIWPSGTTCPSSKLHIKSEKENMPNIKITAEVDGKQVPLENISTETFEAIKALEKPKEIPVARLTACGSSPRLLLKPIVNLHLLAGFVYALDPKDGKIASTWVLERDAEMIRTNCYKNVISL